MNGQPRDYATVDGKQVTVGEWVGFKSDIEQSGRIAEIYRRNGRDYLVLDNPSGFEGEYIRGAKTITIRAEDAWI